MKLKLLLMSLLMFGTMSVSDAQTGKSAKQPAQAGNVVEVLCFHAKKRCATCIAIEKNTKEVVQKEFAAEVKSGRVKLKEIDISTKAGEKIADNYKVTWSSLYVNQWKGGLETRNDMTEFAFANAMTNPEKFKTELKNKINELLK